MEKVTGYLKGLTEGLSSQQAMVCYGVILLIVILIVNSILRKGIKLIIISGVIGLCLFLFGGGVINSKYLPQGTLEMVNEAKEKLGDLGGSYIKTEGNSVYVKVNDNWLCTEDIAIVGDFTKDNVINYEGEDIYLGHSGVYNTIKVLEDVGLLKKEAK